MSQGPAPSALTLARQLGFVPFAEALTLPWSRVVTRKEILERLRAGQAVEAVMENGSLKMTDNQPMWEVWQGSTLVCRGLTEGQARNKVENEKRIGIHMEARPERGDPPPLPGTTREDWTA